MVYTITCHNVYNYGATLQEYALLKYLEKQGYETKTINYRPDYLSGHFNFFSVDNPKFKKNIFYKWVYIILKFPFKLRLYPKKIAFDRFSKKYIKETDKVYFDNNDLINNPPNADVFITGSDQVWNTFFRNGKDPSFYLNFVPDNKLKISYAPSFAIDALDNSIKDFVKQGVLNLDCVSVRELSGQKILENLGIESELVLDPVFLLSNKDWEKISAEKMHDNYIFIYDFDNNPLIKELAQTLKKRHGWQIISISEGIHYADKNYYLKGPEVFLSLIKHANIVLSTSFHALAFSLIFNKNFYIFNRKEKINTRMRDLLLLLDLTNRLIIDRIVILNLEMDYIPINTKLENLIDKSKTFLLKSLNGEKI